METKVQKWGNSYALRIPKTFVREVGLEYNATVNLTVEDGKLIIQPTGGAISLEKLLERITSENIHGEIDSGTPVGKETL
jgi:antitoxin MazE